MSKHPYPDFIIDAVARQLHERSWAYLDGDAAEWEDMTSGGKSGIIHEAHLLLNTLWDASEVRTFGDLAGLPGSAIIANQNGNTSSLNDFLGIQEVGSPAHVIHWGNDDR